MFRAAGATAMLRGLVVEVLALSVTWTVKLAVPGAVGVPLMAPAGRQGEPGGKTARADGPGVAAGSAGCGEALRVGSAYRAAG